VLMWASILTGLSVLLASDMTWLGAPLYWVHVALMAACTDPLPSGCGAYGLRTRYVYAAIPSDPTRHIFRLWCMRRI